MNNHLFVEKIIQPPLHHSLVNYIISSDYPPINLAAARKKGRAVYSLESMDMMAG
jgi:hypothetical protein